MLYYRAIYFTKTHNDSMTKGSFNNIRCCQMKKMHCKSTEEMIFGRSMRDRNSDFQHPDGAHQLTLTVELRNASEVKNVNFLKAKGTWVCK